jgi:large subunit ribosomal protein L11
MAKKEITGYINLQISAGAANPSPPVGPALGQKGVNIMDFCKQFNERSAAFEKGTPIPVKITVFVDRSFEFITKTPPVSYYLKKKAKLKKASKNPGKDFVAKISEKELIDIAKIKIKDVDVPLDSMISMIKGTAISMGIEII